MKPIGGYFELELRAGSHYHVDAIKLNSARNCFEYILRAKQYKKVYIPFYTCEVMLEPIRKLGIEYEFYSIDMLLNPIFEKDLNIDEAFLYTNYFGLKQSTVEFLAGKIGRNLIIDNAQAFYAKPIKGIDTFYSARKFFGVPDGAYLYTDKEITEELELDISSDRMSHLLKRLEQGAEAAYDDFKNNEDSLIAQPIKRMSKLTESILCSIDYEEIKHKRIENYAFLNSALQEINMLSIFDLKNAVPMVYPFFIKEEGLRKKLIKNKIFVPTYWPNVFDWCNLHQAEYCLAKEIIPIPIDQRYNKIDLKTITKICLKK